MRCVNRRTVARLAGILLLAMGVTSAGCSRPADPWKAAKEGQKRVLVSFPPLYCLTSAVAGDDAFVLCFLNTEDPHEYKFSSVDGIKAKSADLLIHNGLGLDDKFVERLVALTKVKTLNVGDALPDEMLMDLGQGHDDGHQHHGSHDPHIWLGPPQAMKIADAIAGELAKLDPTHKEGYNKRAAKLKDDLKKLQADGQARFKEKKSRKVVTLHDSMGYFAKAFGLEVAGTIQIEPHQDADPGRLALLEKLCRDQGVNVITYEPQYKKNQPEIIQKQLKNRGLAIELAPFEPIETAPLAKDSVNPDPGYYMEKMRANIDNLAKALP
jgi:zinc transport system substrate-binding protein